MRILIIILLIVRINDSCFTQTPIINNIVVTTPDRKKVWIIDDPNGRLIYQNWQINPTYEGFEPTVTLVSDLAPYRKKVEKMMKKSKKSK